MSSKKRNLDKRNILSNTHLQQNWRVADRYQRSHRTGVEGQVRESLPSKASKRGQASSGHPSVKPSGSSGPEADSIHRPQDNSLQMTESMHNFISRLTRGRPQRDIDILPADVSVNKHKSLSTIYDIPKTSKDKHESFVKNEEVRSSAQNLSVPTFHGKSRENFKIIKEKDELKVYEPVERVKTRQGLVVVNLKPVFSKTNGSVREGVSTNRSKLNDLSTASEHALNDSKLRDFENPLVVDTSNELFNKKLLTNSGSTNKEVSSIQTQLNEKKKFAINSSSLIVGTSGKGLERLRRRTDHSSTHKPSFNRNINVDAGPPKILNRLRNNIKENRERLFSKEPLYQRLSTRNSSDVGLKSQIKKKNVFGNTKQYDRFVRNMEEMRSFKFKRLPLVPYSKDSITKRLGNVISEQDGKNNRIEGKTNFENITRDFPQSTNEVAARSFVERYFPKTQ